jgi:hypothetical protein
MDQNIIDFIISNAPSIIQLCIFAFIMCTVVYRIKDHIYTVVNELDDIISLLWELI